MQYEVPAHKHVAAGLSTLPLWSCHVQAHMDAESGLAKMDCMVCHQTSKSWQAYYGSHVAQEACNEVTFWLHVCSPDKCPANLQIALLHNVCQAIPPLT